MYTTVPGAGGGPGSLVGGSLGFIARTREAVTANRLVRSPAQAGEAAEAGSAPLVGPLALEQMTSSGSVCIYKQLVCLKLQGDMGEFDVRTCRLEEGVLG